MWRSLVLVASNAKHLQILEECHDHGLRDVWHRCLAALRDHNPNQGLSGNISSVRAGC